MSTLVAVLAHPDDETFRPGGTLALLAESGVTVRLITATLGESGSCGDPPICKPEELAFVREQELGCACVALGIPSPRLLGYPDGKLDQIPAETLVASILSVIEEFDPEVMVSFGPDGLSGHPDHIAIGECAAEVFRRAKSVASLYTLAVPRSLALELDMRQLCPVPDQAITLTVDISPVWEKKLAAMRCHATQWSSSPMITAPEAHQKRFFGREHFIRAASRHSKTDFLPDILQGNLVSPMHE